MAVKWLVSFLLLLWFRRYLSCECEIGYIDVNIHIATKRMMFFNELLPIHAGPDLNKIVNILLEVDWKALASEINMPEGVIREIDEDCAKKALYG